MHVVADALADVDSALLPLETADVVSARSLRDRLSAQLATHLLPRLKAVDHPALVVFGGSTGAGKSTLVNSLVGSEICESGVLRPTTRRPILALNPSDHAAMSGHPLAAEVDVVVEPAVPSGIALLDTPDLDSVSDANRALGTQLLEAADLWVFVTTAARYGDALPWATLQAAHGRGVTVAIVLNRVREAALVEVRGDLHNRLVASGLGGAPLFVLPDFGPHEGLLPREAVADLDDWLELLAGKSHGATVVSRTIRGTWPGLREDLTRLADAVDAQVAAADELRSLARDLADAEAVELRADVEHGATAEGGPTTQWLAAASAGGVLEPLVGTAGRPRARGRPARHRSAAVDELRESVVGAAAAAVEDASTRAHRQIRTTWERPALGGAGLAAGIDPEESLALARAHRAETAIRTWCEHAVDDVEARVPVLGGRAGRLLDTRGWAGLVCAAAAGVDGAARAVDALLGAPGTEAREAARSALGEVARDLVRAEAEVFVRAVDALGLDESAALGLRVRASELRGVV